MYQAHPQASYLEEGRGDPLSSYAMPDISLTGFTGEDSAPPPTKIDISKTFAGSFSRKLRILGEAIQEIDRLMELRKALSQSVQKRIETELSASDWKLSQVKPWQLGHNQSIEMRRLGLEQEIIALRREKRNEEVR